MRKANPALKARRPNQAALDEFIEQITVDAYGEDEQLWAFRQAFEDGVAGPCGALVIGEPVLVVAFDYDGNERRGLTAQCSRPDGRKHVVAHPMSSFRTERKARGTWARIANGWGSHLFHRRLFLDLAAQPAVNRPKAITAHQQVELAVLSVKSQTARCRFLGSDRTVTLRSRRFWVPGEIVRVKSRKEWTYGNPHLSAEIESARIEAPALGLTPLRLEERGIWNPIQEYWGAEGEPIERWAKPIIARSPRQAFEMEQVLPGYDFSDPECDPIGVSNDLKDSGHAGGCVQSPDGTLWGGSPLSGRPCPPGESGFRSDRRGCNPPLRSGLPDRGIIAARRL